MITKLCLTVGGGVEKCPDAIILSKGNECYFENHKMAYKRKLVPIAPITANYRRLLCFFSYFRFNKLTRSQLQSQQISVSTLPCVRVTSGIFRSFRALLGPTTKTLLRILQVNVAYAQQSTKYFY